MQMYKLKQLFQVQLRLLPKNIMKIYFYTSNLFLFALFSFYAGSIDFSKRYSNSYLGNNLSLIENASPIEKSPLVILFLKVLSGIPIAPETDLQDIPFALVTQIASNVVTELIKAQFGII